MSLIKHNKSYPSGFSVSQGGLYPVAGFDPLNYKTSVPLGKSTPMQGTGIVADIFGVIGGVAGSIAGTAGGPYVAGVGGYLAGSTAKAIGEMMGLGLGNPRGAVGKKKKVVVSASHKKKIKSLKGGFLGITLANTKKLLNMIAAGATMAAVGVAAHSMGLPESSKQALIQALHNYLGTTTIRGATSVLGSNQYSTNPDISGSGLKLKGGIGRPEKSKVNFSQKEVETLRKALTGKGIFAPNVSAYGLARF